MTKGQQYILIGALFVVLLFLLWRGCNKQQQLQETVSLYESVQDTLHQARNKLGQQSTSTALVEAFNEKLFLRLQTQDTAIIKLQKVVRDFRGQLQSASIFTNVTSTAGAGATTVTGGDTVFKDSLVFVYPIYESAWIEKWSSGNIQATKDSIYRDIKVKNEYEMTLGYTRDKWWKTKQPTVTILNLNPNTETTELKSFNVKNANKKLGLGVNISYGVGAVDFKPQVFVGVGVNYNIISLK